jgi:hypothetical protein
LSPSTNPRRTGHFRFTVRAENVCVSTIRSFDLLVTGNPILLTHPAEIVFRYRPGEQADLEDVVRVEGSWPDLAYSVQTANAPWLHILPSLGKTPDAESALTADRVRLRADPANLEPGTYHAALKFYADNSENAAVVNVTLQVLKAQ